MAAKRGKASATRSKAPRPTGIGEVLRRKTDDVVVPPGRSVTAAHDTEFADYFVKLRLQSFDDLRELHLVSPRLDQARTRAAIVDDDARALALAHEQLRSGPAECGCRDTNPGRTPPPFHERLASSYGALRKHQHFALASLISQAIDRQVPWDSLEAKVTWSWVAKLAVLRTVDIWAFLAKDIVVGKNSTLTVGASTKYLLANDIKIHAGGKIVVKGSYIKVRCNSAHGNLA